MKKSALTLVLLMTSVLMLQGQPHYFRHYQVEQGLSHNSVTSSLQDKQGFMWFGTKDGLNRFDGYSFKIFRHDPDDPGSIGSNSILKLCENNGKLWVGTDKGLFQYDEVSEKFKLLEETEGQYIRNISKDHNGNLWFIAGTSLHRYDEGQNELKLFPEHDYFPATAICTTEDGSVWVSSSSGTINRYDTKQDSFLSFDLFDHSKPASTTWIETIYPTGRNSILVGTQRQGVKLFEIAQEEYIDLVPNSPDGPELFVRDFVKVTEDEYWIATESGIYIYDLDTKTTTILQKSYNDPYSITDNAVYTVFRDREGGVWAGTYFGGVNHHPKQNTLFEKFFPKTGENSLSGNAVREICQDQYGNLWIGTEDAGLNKLNLREGTFENFKPTGRKGDISHYNIHGLLVRGNELWIGTFHRGLDILDIPSGKVIRHYSNGSGSLKSDFIHTIVEAPGGEIYLGTSKGLYQYFDDIDDFVLHPGFPEAYHYTAILEDSHGVLWAGTYRDGVYFYEKKTGKKGFLKNQRGDKNSLSSDAINGIYEDSSQNIWVLTNEGINKYVPEQHHFRRFSTQAGFPSNVTYRMLEDKDQKLWISTSKGLVHFDPDSEETDVYTKAHGLLSDQLNYSSSFKDTEGRSYFGTVKGLVRFDPAAFRPSDYVPPVYITGFQVHNQELPVEKTGSPLTQSVSSTNKVTLAHDQSSFSLDFAALSYTAPQTTAYAYKMEGLDKEWTYLKTNRKAFFTDLSPGEYVFKVKSQNMSGIWTARPTEMLIEVLPPIWASHLAYFFYTLVAVLALYQIIHSYHRRLVKKNKHKIRLLQDEKEKELYKAKIEFFTNVAHEIRTPLTLIKGPLEKVIKTTFENPGIQYDLHLMHKNTSRLLELADQLLDFQKTEVKGFNLSFTHTDIRELVAETYHRFRPGAEQKKLVFRLSLPDDAVNAYVDREALTKILNNLTDNAIKYADSLVDLKLHALAGSDECFVVETKNDGRPLFPEAKEEIFAPFFRFPKTEHKPGAGIGLPLSRSLAELHSGTLDLKESRDGFNRFVLRLPLHQDKEYKLFDKQVVKAPTIKPDVNSDHSPGRTPILIVEDNVEMLDFISRELSGEYTVFKANGGEAAFEILNSEIIQLIVCDVMMATINGIELCKRVKSTIDFSHIPIILLTSRTNLQSKIEGLESGADAYMEKPFSLEHLKVQLANLLTNRSKIKDFFSSSPLAHIKSIAYSKADEAFLDELNNAIHENIADSDLNVEHLADIMNISRPTLYRKIKAISNLTPNELINVARLKKAAELLAEDNYRIYEIANIVGYNSQTSFGRNFLKQFGMKPSQYASSKRKIFNK